MREILYQTYNKSKNLHLNWFLPDTNDFPVIVYAHGGGLIEGGYCGEPYDSIGRDFANQGIGFVSVEYRLYPLNKYPTFLEDFAEAVKYVKEHIKEFRGSGEIYISGQSAGAWLASMLCLDSRWLNQVNIDPLEIKGWIIDSGQMTSHFHVIQYELGLDPSSQRIDQYAPLFYLNKETVFTKMLIIYYENDMPTRPEQNVLFGASVKQFNPRADITLIKLKGGHCFGSSFRDQDGEFPYVKETIKFMRK